MTDHHTSSGWPERGLQERIRSGALNTAEREGLALLVGSVADAQRTVSLGHCSDAQTAGAWVPVGQALIELLPAFGRSIRRLIR